MHSAYARIGRPRTCQTPWLGLGMNAGAITAGIRLDMASRNATRPVQPRPGTPGHDEDSVHVRAAIARNHGSLVLLHQLAEVVGQVADGGVRQPQHVRLVALAES